MIVDDDIHENDQSFALLGNIVANGSVCFQSPSKQDDDEPGPCKQMGVAEILIIDDDRKCSCMFCDVLEQNLYIPDFINRIHSMHVFFIPICKHALADL